MTCAATPDHLSENVYPVIHRHLLLPLTTVHMHIVLMDQSQLFQNETPLPMSDLFSDLI